MSYSRVMPNIKPFPQQPDNRTDIAYFKNQQSQQPQLQQYQQNNHSIYRPAYHRIPSTPAIASRQTKDSWASLSPEISPIVVPSMSTSALQSHYLNFYQGNNMGHSFQPYYHSNINKHATNYHSTLAQQTPMDMHCVPIHRTLENATITYDTVEQNFHKDLVKDVFFSPAMNTCRQVSPSVCSSLSVNGQSDNESDMVSTPSYQLFSSQETPSELLLDDDSNEILFEFGLDLATISATDSYQSTTSSYEEVAMFAGYNKKKPTFTLSNLKSFDIVNTSLDLPTPPASLGDSDHLYDYAGLQNKRRCSDSVLQERLKKKKRRVGPAQFRPHNQSMSTLSTPPDSPRITLPNLKHESLPNTNYNYFDEASEEEFDEVEQDQNRSSLEYNRFGRNILSCGSTAASEFRQATFKDEDSFSFTSWEEEDTLSDSGSEKDEDFIIPEKYTTKKNKRSHAFKQVQSFVETEEENQSFHEPRLPLSAPRPTAYPTIYQKLTRANVDWCRYCGTTEGVNWRPGPWGKRTLCNKHGCDYKGYGFACKLPRLDLKEFVTESIHDRDRPVLQLYCSGCQRKESWEGNVLVRCEGCPKAYHQKCFHKTDELNGEFVASKKTWFCDPSCCENAQRKRIIVELPRKRLPLMRSSKSNCPSSASSVSSERGLYPESSIFAR